jgi:RNA polymerase sigma-70 factor (ECF subfamily)
MWPDADKTKRLLEGARNGDDDAINRLVGMRLDQQIRQRVDVSDVIQDVLIEANRRL